MDTDLFFSLVFSQSLISLDLIEDFLELASREKTEDKDKPLIYKGELCLYIIIFKMFIQTYKHFNNRRKKLPGLTTLIYIYFSALSFCSYPYKYGLCCCCCSKFFLFF